MNASSGEPCAVCEGDGCEGCEPPRRLTAPILVTTDAGPRAKFQRRRVRIDAAAAEPEWFARLVDRLPLAPALALREGIARRTVVEIAFWGRGDTCVVARLDAGVDRTGFRSAGFRVVSDRRWIHWSATIRVDLTSAAMRHRCASCATALVPAPSRG